MKVTLSSAFAQNAVCLPGKRRTDYWSNQIPGFILSVRESGQATWSLRYVQNGRQRDHKIGRYGDITFDHPPLCPRVQRAAALAPVEAGASKLSAQWG